MSQTGSVLVFCEPGPTGEIIAASVEMLGLGKRVAQAMGSELSALATDEMANEVGAYGVSHIYTATPPAGRRYCPEWHVAFVETACNRYDPAAIIFAHTPLGQDIAPRLAERVRGGLVTDCIAISVDRQDLVATKPVQGGVALATYSFNTRPAVVTVRRGVESMPARDESLSATSIKVDIPFETGREWEVMDHVVEESSETKLEDAEVVISGGRGIGGPEGFDMLRKLASALGAAVGASRPACDSGWVPSSSQIGITGKSVSPEVYIAVGISGASQHLSGMGGSKVVVAINNNAEADIFRMADYGIVGDYRSILPPLIDAVNRLKTGGS